MLCHSEVIGDFVKSIFSLVQEGDHFLAETDVNHCLIQISFSLKTRAARSKKNIYILPQYCTQSFLGHTSTCTGTGTLTKVLESAPSDRQTNKSYSSI